MPRSKITSKSQDLITDDGSIIASIVYGEQTRINITTSWITNLSGYTITAKVVEAILVTLAKSKTFSEVMGLLIFMPAESIGL